MAGRLVRPDFYELDIQAVLRLPEKFAEKLRDRYSAAENEASLNLKIEHTPNLQERGFHVEFDGEELQGILLDLPCHVETWKTHDDDTFAKSGDINQVLWVYEKDEFPYRHVDGGTAAAVRHLMAGGGPEDPRTAQLLKDANFQCISGITPGTHRIRQRRFRKYPMDPGDVKRVEEMIDEIVQEKRRDTYVEDMVEADKVEEEINPELLLHMEYELNRANKGMGVTCVEDLDPELSDDLFGLEAPAARRRRRREELMRRKQEAKERKKGMVGGTQRGGRGGSQRRGGRGGTGRGGSQPPPSRRQNQMGRAALAGRSASHAPSSRAPAAAAAAAASGAGFPSSVNIFVQHEYRRQDRLGKKNKKKKNKKPAGSGEG